MIKILIADDSIFMRKLLSDLFEEQPDFKVVGVAHNGKDAVEKTAQLSPDLLTMDVNMPVMDGLEALAIIMKEHPLPVVMISSMTKTGAEATLRALELGAVDFISKVSGTVSSIADIQNEILEKCRAAAAANWRISAKGKPVPVEMEEPPVSKVRPVELMSSPFPKSASGTGQQRLVAIGTSTGGPRALQQVITQLPADLPCGVVVVQHMPPGFTKSLSERLDSLSKVKVKEAEDNDLIEPGHVYIAPGNYHMQVKNQSGLLRISLNQEPPLASHRPSVDVLFDSVASVGRRLTAVIMTGMGSDGAKGMQKIKSAGGYVIAEDESTSVVYGMPKAVVDLGIADKVLPLPYIAGAIVNAVKNG
ncbi:MAG: protein-glutamate methylesterase/protein-glutamine glutaminase [Selenomonadaceae bacterium]